MPTYQPAGSATDSYLNQYAHDLTPDQLANWQATQNNGYSLGHYASNAGQSGNSGSDINPTMLGDGGYAMSSPTNSDLAKGGWENMYDPTGKFQGQYFNKPDSSALKAFDTATEAVLAYAFGGVGMGAAGLGTLPGVAGAAPMGGTIGAEGLAAGGGAMGGGASGLAAGGAYLSPGEMDAALASQTAAGGGVMGGGAAAAGGGLSTFNPAVDSQLASSQLGLTATDTAAGGIPSVGGAGNVAAGAAGGGFSLPPGVSPGQIAGAVGAATGGGAGASGGGSGGSAGGGSNPLGNLNLGNLVGLLGGAWDMNNQNNASQQMLDYLKSRQSINDNMYAPGSPEYNALWDSMSRNDAAAGRNSQYGPRSVDLAARVAQLKMDANTKMTTGIGNLYANAINKGAASNSGLMSQLGNLLGNGSGSGTSGLNLNQIMQWLNSGGGNGTNVPGTPYPQQQPFDPAQNPADPNLDSNPDVNGNWSDWADDFGPYF